MFATLHLDSQDRCTIARNAFCRGEGKLLNTEPAPLPRKSLLSRLFDYISQGGKPAISGASAGAALGLGIVKFLGIWVGAGVLHGSAGSLVGAIVGAVLAGLLGVIEERRDAAKGRAPE